MPNIPPHPFDPPPGGPPALGPAECRFCPLPKENAIHSEDYQSEAALSDSVTLHTALTTAIFALNYLLDPHTSEHHDFLKAEEDAEASLVALSTLRGLL